MSMEMIENIAMLLAAVIGLFLCVFRYIGNPKKGWLFATIFFLAHFLSDYYWAAYYFIIHDSPDVSEIVAYFGWNVAYLVLFIAALHMREEGAKKFFHPLMLLPIPVNIAQFFLYIQFGGIVNNLLTSLFLTGAAVMCMQSILYYLKKRKEGAHFPYFSTVVIALIITSYAMWTSSCFDVSFYPVNPYYIFASMNYICMILFASAIGKDYEQQGLVQREKSISDMRFQMMLEMTASIIIFGGCILGLHIATVMKDSLAAQMPETGYGVIAMTLFIISVALVILILLLILLISNRYRQPHESNESSDIKGSRNTFIMTIFLSFALMIFSVSYTSRLFYKVSAGSIYSLGADTSRLVATEIENYLSSASSALQVTADTVDTMLKRGESQEKILQFIVDQTENQARQFDENFTGLYALVRGEYMDGTLWTPPEDYNPLERDWYLTAVGDPDEVVIVPPYIDAQTGEVVLSICRQISDVRDQERFESKNVVALDVIVNHVQELVEQTTINGKGTAMVIDKNGLIISHKDRDLVGTNFSDQYPGTLFYDLMSIENGTVDKEVEGTDYTVFVRRIMNQWYTVIAVSDDELLEETHLQLGLNIVVSFVIFALISFFYYLGYKNEQFYGRRMEEMRISKNKQEYEAKALMLEKQAADEANKAKSSFLADMSHEIRTPINAILGMNEMIQRESKDPNILEYSGNIGASGRNLLQLINSILDFSKIEDGKMEIVPVRYKTAGSIAYLYNSIIERARSKGLDFKVDADKNLPSELFGDDTRINQVIMNLLTNAVKYTREGSVTLTFREKERKENSVLLYVEVKDTGIGIREEDMSKLFESFERLDLVKNRNIEGTGLGMSIATNLLSLMDSSLKVESVYGEGSVFSFAIWQEIKNDTPLGDFDLTAPGVTGKEKKEGESLLAPDAHILVVDDTKMNLMVVEKLLKRTQIKVETAPGGQQALELAKENAYDVILMDQRMPGMDGTETLQKLRELEGGRNASCPVICLTADAIRGAKEKYIAEGFTDYLTKPVNGKDLEKMLLSYLPPEKVVRGI